ncbi:MAG: protein phosphatase 2C domain-containing protein [Cyanobacteria bacterium J06559_3]
MRRYLWAQGSVSIGLEPGTVLAERYQVVQFPLLLDTAPADPPAPLEAVPASAEPYLALSHFPVSIPRPFTQIVLAKTGKSLLLLEEIPIRSPEEPFSEIPPLLPTLTAAWAEATALQQATWLWQIAKLWQPSVDNQVAGALLDWENIRVDGEDVRLVSLQVAATSSPTLADLGSQWRPLLEATATPLRSFLTQLVEDLSAGQGTSAGLVNAFTQALEVLSAPQKVAVQFATYSDQGPTRKRNEDACYPQSGTVSSTSLAAKTVTTTPAPFVIVCDGIGGHQGGNVASQIAIDEVAQQLQALGNSPNLIHDDLVFLLEKAILAANQAISSRNDAAQRQDRARMGTTIALAFVYGARLYIAHLGDSRVYRVRSHNCRQITLDDDVATREMRLGLQLYRDALQTSGSGALVQALGMASSRHLHPTVELYPLTQESVFLLCSDGLSDQDLVERLWTAELRPTVMGDRDVATAGKRLIKLANTHNGHDNVTVGVLHVVPQPSNKVTTVPITSAAQLMAPVMSSATATQKVTQVVAPSSSTPQQAVPTVPKRRRAAPIMLTSIAIAGLLGIAGIYAWNRFGPLTTGSDSAPTTASEPLSPQATPPIPVADPVASDLAVGDYLQIQAALDTTSAATVVATASPPVSEPPSAVDLPERSLSVGSIVQVINRQKTPDNRLWVRLQVCSVAAEVTRIEDDSVSAPSTPATDTPELEPNATLPTAVPGDQGWSLQTSVTSFADRLLDTSPTQQGLCTN